MPTKTTPSKTILENLNLLLEEANSSKHIFGSAENKQILEELIEYFDPKNTKDIKRNLTIHRLPSLQQAETKIMEMVDNLAALKTKKPERIKIIRDLIDQVCMPQTIYQIAYCELSKLKVGWTGSKFLKNNEQTVNTLFDYIKANKDNLDQHEQKTHILSLLSQLKTDQQERKSIIEKIKNYFILPKIYLNTKYNLSTVTPNQKETETDWERTFKDVKINHGNINNIDELTKFLSKLMPNLDEDTIQKILNITKCVNLCGTDDIMRTQGYMVSQAVNSTPSYEITSANKDIIKINFQVDGTCGQPGSREISKGTIQIKCMINHAKGTYDIEREFYENKLNPEMSPRRQKRK